MMAELKKYKLGEICKITSSKRIFEKEYVDGGIPFIRGQEISDGSIANPSSEFLCYISPERYEELKKNYGVPKKNDILITAVGTIGNTYLVEDNKKFYFKDGNIIWFKNIKKEVYPLYLLFFMKSPFFNQQIEYSLIGAVQKALTIVMLSKIEISLPSLATQRKIATVLSNIDRKISVNREINRNLEELAKQIYDYWFVQFDFPNNKGRPYKSSGGKMVWNELLKREIPSGWEVKRVSEVIESVERGISYTFDDIKNVNGIPMLNLACYDKSGEYRSGEFKFFSGKCSNKVYPFEMFIACTDMTQNADIIGRPIFAPTEFKEYVYSMDLAKITPKSISKMYLYYTLRTSFYHKYIKPFASGTNVKHLNINGTERYVISLPAKEEQEKFENTITPIKEKQQNCLKEIQQLSVLRDTLLPLLMNGQVTLNSCLSHD
jgi:restriction modification system DNA specificity domain protein